MNWAQWLLISLFIVGDLVTIPRILRSRVSLGAGCLYLIFFLLTSGFMFYLVTQA